MARPKRFRTRLDWDCFVLECAIQDRAAYKTAWKDADDKTGEVVRIETTEEIEAMREQLRKLRTHPRT